jgi:chromate transporter
MCVLLSVVAIGGPGATISAAHDVLVERLAVLTAAQFSAIYGLSAASPGPNIIFFLALTYAIHGWAGVAIAALCYVLPLGVMAGAVGWAGERFRTPSMLRFHRSLHPIVLGLGLSAAVVAGAPLPPTAMALSVGSVVLLLTTKLNPALVVIGLAILGALVLGH